MVIAAVEKCIFCLALKKCETGKRWWHKKQFESHDRKHSLSGQCTVISNSIRTLLLTREEKCLVHVFKQIIFIFFFLLFFGSKPRKVEEGGVKIWKMYNCPSFNSYRIVFLIMYIASAVGQATYRGQTLLQAIFLKVLLYLLLLFSLALSCHYPVCGIAKTTECISTMNVLVYLF